MLFNSWEFAVLVVALLPLYYLPAPGAGAWRHAWQVLVLLAGSAVFYGWSEPRLLGLLGVSCGLNALAVGRILRWRAREEELVAQAAQRANRWMKGAVVANLLTLVVFKYAGFLLSVLPGLPAAWQLQASTIPLPVGISFYTFQGISLVVDTWRGDLSSVARQRLAKPGRKGLGRLRDLSFYISFFPQLVAGPIVKARDFVGQIGAKSWGEIDWKVVRRSLISGYFLKIVVADNLAEQTAALTLGPEVLEVMGPLVLLPLLYSYSLQIFADFAGYSLIAIGLGALFGYRLPENFRFPYLSRSLTEFWRRWHLTLSAWLRDYLYIPLGGNRSGRVRTYVNLLLVMLLGGLWHGAATKFLAWGLLHGLLLAVERMVLRRRGRLRADWTTGPVGSLRALLGWAYAVNAVTFLWLSFLMPDLASITAFFRGLAAPAVMSGPPLFALGVFGSGVVMYHLWGWLEEHRPSWVERFRKPAIEGLLHGLLLFLILTNPGAPRGFIYFQF